MTSWPARCSGERAAYVLSTQEPDAEGVGVLDEVLGAAVGVPDAVEPAPGVPSEHAARAPTDTAVVRASRRRRGDGTPRRYVPRGPGTKSRARARGRGTATMAR